MIARALLAIALSLATLAATAPARAERLIVSVSNHRVTVTPNYSGEELVLFGSVEKDANTPANRAYDLVVTVAGPRADMVTRRKERKFGIWINTDSRQFLQVPAYLAIFSNRPYEAIASPEVQRRQQVGINNVVLTQRVGPDYADVVPNDPFRSAFVRLRTQHGLYREATSAVTFLTPTLFRTGIPLPAEVPIGTYNVDIKLFADGQLVTRTETAFEIVKVGFEQFVANTAQEQRPRLRTCHRDDGADDRLDGVDRVPQGLMILMPRRRQGSREARPLTGSAPSRSMKAPLSPVAILRDARVRAPQDEVGGVAPFKKPTHRHRHDAHRHRRRREPAEPVQRSSNREPAHHVLASRHQHQQHHDGHREHAVDDSAPDTAPRSD